LFTIVIQYVRVVRTEKPNGVATAKRVSERSAIAISLAEIRREVNSSQQEVVAGGEPADQETFADVAHVPRREDRA
jgi:hypothetical protein